MGRGAGSGGLTAAYEAARLGHKVTLFEKEEETGGQLRLARKVPFKDQYGTWVSWLTAQAKKMGVILRTGTEVTESIVSEGKPEVVILASGGEPIRPDIPGINLPLVCHAWQVLGGMVPREKCGCDWRWIGWHGDSRFPMPERSAGNLVEVLKRSPVLKITSHGYMLHTRLKETGCRLLFNTAVRR